MVAIMDLFAASLLSGISLGIVYFLIATGLSVVMGLMGIINLAHGAIFMIGAYLGITVAYLTKNFVLGIVAGTVAAGLAGLAIERGFLRGLYKRALDQILVTFGFVYIVTNLHLWIYGPWPKSSYVPPALAGSVSIGSLELPVHRFAIIVVGAAVCLCLWWLQEKTKVGAIVRAGMDDAEMVSGLGINLTPITIGVFFLGSALAGFAGIVGAPLLGGVNLQSGLKMLSIALAICIVGGVGSIQGAMAGALLIGVATALAATYVPVLDIYVMYIAMVAILIFKPTGLLGRRF
jgi:branched-chain amino acid transport system permease protein